MQETTLDSLNHWSPSLPQKIKIQKQTKPIQMQKGKEKGILQLIKQSIGKGKRALPFILLISDQIWRVGLNFNWKVIYSLSPSKMKGNINNCTSIVKYKLTEPFHQKTQKKILFFQIFTILNNWAPLNIYKTKNDKFSIKIILNTLSCHTCIINFTVQ